MTQTITIPAVNLIEYPGSTRKKVLAVVRVSDLRGVNFPLGPNVRRPTRNGVVDSLLQSFASYQGSYTVESPIQMCCRSIQILKDRNTGQVFLECDLSDLDGVLDGGHRIKAATIANLNRDTYETDNIFFQFLITAGLDQAGIKEKAIAANTSKNPSKMDLMHYAGDFDHIKAAIAGSIFTKVCFYSGQQNVYEESLCLANKIYTFPQLLDPKRSPINIGKPNEQKHPIALSKTDFTNDLGNSKPSFSRWHPQTFSSEGGTSGSTAPSMNTANIRKGLSEQFWLDALQIYCDIGREVAARHTSGTRMPFVRNCSSPKQSSKLPDGTILMCKLPSRLYTQMLLAQFRVFLDENYAWKIPLEMFQERLVKKLVTEIRSRLQLERYSLMTAGDVVRDIDLWDRLYALAAKEYDAALDRYTKAA